MHIKNIFNFFKSIFNFIFVAYLDMQESPWQYIDVWDKKYQSEYNKINNQYSELNKIIRNLNDESFIVICFKCNYWSHINKKTFFDHIKLLKQDHLFVCHCLVMNATASNQNLSLTFAWLIDWISLFIFGLQIGYLYLTKYFKSCCNHFIKGFNGVQYLFASKTWS